MLLGDLLELPDLRLRLLVGDSEVLARPIRWVYTTDLPDPSRYLSGGELVITGLVWRRRTEDTERFVAAVAGEGAAALAAGETVFNGIPDDVVAACRHHRLALIAVPEDVSFAALTEQVVGQLVSARGERLAARLGRQRQLLTAVAGGMTLTELANQVSETVGLPCRILTPTGRSIVSGPVELGSRTVDRLVLGYLTAPRLPATVPGPPGYSVFPVGPALQRLTSWFVAVTGSWPEWPAEVVDAVGELASFAALERSRHTEARRIARDIADDMFRLLEAGHGGGPDITLRLRQAGLNPVGEFTAVTTGFSEERPDLTETSVALLEDAVAGLGPAIVGCTESGHAAALLPATAAEAVAGTLRTSLSRLIPALGSGRLVAGVSLPTGTDALAGAFRQARRAMGLARLRPGAVQVVSDAEVTSHTALLATVPDDVRRAFAARILDPIVDYDTRNGSGLLETLTVYLDNSGSWSRVADQLHLHVNTVRYRIGRVEELTGRDLGRFEDRVDLFLALRSR
jgi:hypothetical protein